MHTDRYHGKNVFISGGSSGIGLATAKLFASLGAHVFIFARRVTMLERAIREIEALHVSTTQRFSFSSIDVTDSGDVALKLEAAVAGFGNPHIVINSAGLAYPDYFEKIPYEKFDETIKINLYGTWNVLTCLVPHMKGSGGHIVNISSVAGFIGVFGYTAYSASKFALIGFSESLRSEMKPYGIKVSVLCPPDTDTPGLALENETKPPELKAISGNAGLMSPQDVAQAMLKGMEKNKFLIIPGFEGKSIYAAKHLFPHVVECFMDFQISRVRRSPGKDK